MADDKFIHVPKTKHIESSSKYACKPCWASGRKNHRWQCPYCLGSGALVYFDDKELRIKGLVLPVDIKIEANVLHCFYSENSPRDYFIKGFYWSRDRNMKSGWVKACEIMVRLKYKDVVWKEVCIDLSVLLQIEWANSDEVHEKHNMKDMLA